MSQRRRHRSAFIPAVAEAALVFGIVTGCGGTSPTTGPPSNGQGSSTSGGSLGFAGGSSGGNDGTSSSGNTGSGGGSSGGSSGSGGSSSSGNSSAGGSSSGGGSNSSSGSGHGSSSSGSSGSDAGAGSSGSSTGSPRGSGAVPTMLPTAQGTCPTLKTGPMQSIMLNGKAMSWSLSVGTKASSPTGPIVIYWHGTGQTAQESATALGNGITDIDNLGGLVAAADSTSGTGTTTGNMVWYTGDVDYAELIIACAIQQLNIDTSHIHVAGYSAGALQTGYMWYARSGYIASAIVYSGGGFGAKLQDTTNAPSLLGAHGAAGGTGCTITSTNCDFLAGSTTTFEQSAKSLGAPIVIDCDDGSSHVDITRLTRLAPVAWPFFKDHPFKGAKPDPYAGALPSGFPSYCKIQ